MKTKLLLLLLIFANFCFAQSITKFQSDPATDFTVITASTALDQTPTSMNATWNFTGLTGTDSNVDIYTTPTAGQLTTYPGTTEVLTITDQGNMTTVAEFFLKENGSGTSITGIGQGDITLNYSGTNAFIGLFPLAYNANNSTAVSGTFSFQGSNGTFTGTATSNVDAYGTLNMTNGIGGSFTATVTRLRIDQTLSFSIPPIFNNIGTLTQTTYYYYSNTADNIVFRYNSANLVSGFLGINETIETIEANAVFTLSTDTFNNDLTFQIYPNPTQDFLNLKTSNNSVITSINIIDTLGRKVLTSNENLDVINVSNLQSGMYVISISTDSGKTTTKKFIKN